MIKKFLLLPVMALIAAASFGQTTKPKLEEVKNDPKTTQNAAKADVNVADNKATVDNEAVKKVFIKRRAERAQRVKQHKHKRTS